MSGLLAWLLLRPLLERPMRLVAGFAVGGAVAVVTELLLQRYVDPELPRVAAATLILALGAAGLFLRASWRRASWRRARRRLRRQAAREGPRAGRRR
jgi:hypothetical protein